MLGASGPIFSILASVPGPRARSGRSQSSQLERATMPFRGQVQRRSRLGRAPLSMDIERAPAGMVWSRPRPLTFLLTKRSLYHKAVD